MEHFTQGKGKEVGFEHGGKAIKTFGVKRPRLVV
jgi:hypothetical protein